MTIIKRTAIVALLIALVTIAFSSSAQAASAPTRACSTKHSTFCVYDAKHRGDHKGRSYWVARTGKRHYVTHAKAHQMLHVAKPRPAAKPVPVVPTVPAIPPTVEKPADPVVDVPEVEAPVEIGPLPGVVAVGDSITAADGSWAEVLFGRDGLSGRPGDCVVRYCWAWWPLVLDFHLDVERFAEAHTMIVEMGTNDIAVGASAEEIIAGYQTLQQMGADAGKRVILMTILPRGTFAWDRISVVNDWVRTQDHLDMTPCVGDGAAAPALKPAYDSGDHLHPSLAGHQKIAQCVYTALAS